MKRPWKLAFFASLLLAGCSQPPDLQTAELQRYYAEMGETMTPTIKKVEQRNVREGTTTPHLSTTNRPVQN
ncbi:MAG TPA: hypothetical protein VIT23_16250 [Terrimicrobiaceae bacterium]